MNSKDKGISAVQLMMMALGTVIGGSFFLGSAVAINAAGPSILISYILCGVLVYLILFALSEMTVADPDTGSFRTFAARVFGKGTGFVVGWVYWTGMVLAMSSEATAVSILIRQWIPNVSISLLGGLIIISVTLINLLGINKLSKLESGLAAIKLLTIVFFIIIGLVLFILLIQGNSPIGVTQSYQEPFMAGGLKGIAGSILIVMFSYAGFEIIGLAASEADNPVKTVPKAIKYTVLSLVGLYIASITVMLLLVPTTELSENVSPMAAALQRWGVGWASTAINLVLISAILSTMLAAMFGLGRMIRSLANEGLAPKWLKDNKDVPYKGILFSGLAMLGGLGIGLLFPSVYLFLISSGGFALLFTYAVIVATHIRFRKLFGCPPEGKCQLRGYPYTSWIVLLSLIIAIFSMPFIPGQASGLIAGITMTIVYSVSYLIIKFINTRKTVNYGLYPKNNSLNIKKLKTGFSTELSDELIRDEKDKSK